MENIKQSLENIRKHLKRRAENQATNNPAIYIQEVLDIVAMIELALDQNKTLVGLGYISYSEGKKYQDFSVSCMYERGFLLSEGSEE